MNNLEKIIGYNFNNKDLLKVSMTHSSCSSDIENNERLEYLGDAVLELIISEYLYLNHAITEGKMTRLRSNIVCSESLSLVSKELNLGNYLEMGKGEAVTGGRKRKSNLANFFEALIGAIYLDSNYAITRGIVLKVLNNNINLALKGNLVKDYKTELQEYIQQYGESVIEYVLEKTTGPEHNKTFFMNLNINGELLSKGKGKNKKEAEQEAAKKYLKKIAENINPTIGGENVLKEGSITRV